MNESLNIPEVQRSRQPATVNLYMVTFLLTLSGILVLAAIFGQVSPWSGPWTPGSPRRVCWLFCRSREPLG